MTDGEGEKLQEVTLKEVNDSVLLGQKPRITLFYTCQAIRLYEEWHDVFACKPSFQPNPSYHPSVPHGTLTYIKEKPCPRAEKQYSLCEYDTVQAPTKRSYATTFRAPLA